MKTAWPLSFGAAVCCHAVVLFALEVTPPTLVSTDAGTDAGAMGVELLGTDGPEAAPVEVPASAPEEAAPQPEPSAPLVEPVPEPKPAPTLVADSLTVPEPVSMLEPALVPMVAKAPAPQTAARKSAPPKASLPRGGAGRSGPGSETARGGGTGAQNEGWDTEARPRYRSNPPPVYPPTALRSRAQGIVMVSVEVSAAGSPVSMALKQSSGFRDLDESALQAVRHWRFEPAQKAGFPVACRIEVPVAFNLLRRN